MTMNALLYINKLEIRDVCFFRYKSGFVTKITVVVVVGLFLIDFITLPTRDPYVWKLYD